MEGTYTAACLNFDQTQPRPENGVRKNDKQINCQRQIEMSGFLQSRNVRYCLFFLRYGAVRWPLWADFTTDIFLQG